MREPGVLRNTRKLIYWWSKDSEVAIAREGMSQNEAFTRMVVVRT